MNSHMYLLGVAMETVAPLKAHCVVLLSPVSQSPCLRATRQDWQRQFCRWETTQAVDRVEALIACNVFTVAGRPVVGNSVVRVKGT
jgi:hypothetical protein